jgi:drug/metabolite transporter (DMT)-like permease
MLMPALGAMFAWLRLGENSSAFNILALVLGTVGVAVVNGLIRVRKKVD